MKTCTLCTHNRDAILRLSTRIIAQNIFCLNITTKDDAYNYKSDLYTHLRYNIITLLRTIVLLPIRRKTVYIIIRIHSNVDILPVNNFAAIQL